MTAALVTVLMLITGYIIATGHHRSVHADNGDALEIGFHRLIAGLDPYAVRTYAGNPITPGLGGILLAGPILLILGSLELQALVWVYAMTAGLRQLGGSRSALAFVSLMLVSPFMLRAWPLQYDYWINAAALVLFGSLGLRAAERRRPFVAVAIAVLFGLAMAYRLALAVALVPLAILMKRRCGGRVTITWVTTACIVCALLTAVPLVIDAESFAPSLHVMTSRAGASGLLIGFLCLLLLAVLSSRVRSLAGVWAVAAVITGVGFSLTALAQVPDAGWLYALASYQGIAGMGAVLVFGIVALVLPLQA